MNNDPVYEIARYDVSTDEEVLIERAQVLASDGELRIRVDDGPENLCAEIDLSAAIGADPVLSEVRANQVTRITATPGRSTSCHSCCACQAKGRTSSYPSGQQRCRKNTGLTIHQSGVCTESCT